MNLSNYEKVKDTENCEIFLEKDRSNKTQISMVVKYKKYNRTMICLLTNELFKLFFNPNEYNKVYMNNIINNQRGR